jgi:replicative DNA helicase
MNLSAPIYRLKREARLLSRRDDIALAAALDRIAATEGFASWSLLAARYAASSPAARLYANLRDGELVLVAARPGHGKTLFALQLALEALRNGHKAHVFSLEYTRAQVEGRFEAIGGAAELAQLAIDTSDSIGSGHVEAALASAPAGTLAVIDYLQLLDQRRDNLPLARQVADLRLFARRRGIVLVFVSQVDRSFEGAGRAMPDSGDIRLPNPVDLGQFDRLCFLHDGEMQVRTMS